MKYLAILALLLFARQSTSAALAATDTAKTGKGMMMHDGDSCKDCKDGHGAGMMMGHDGMGHDGAMMGHDGAMMGHDGAMMCREGGMNHEGGMMGNGGMECGGRGCQMMGGGMHRGGVIGMIIHGLFALLGLIALVLLIMIEMHWVRLLSNRVKASKVIAVTTKDPTM